MGVGDCVVKQGMSALEILPFPSLLTVRESQRANITPLVTQQRGHRCPRVPGPSAGHALEASEKRK